MNYNNLQRLGKYARKDRKDKSNKHSPTPDQQARNGKREHAASCPSTARAININTT